MTNTRAELLSNEAARDSRARGEPLNNSNRHKVEDGSLAGSMVTLGKNLSSLGTMAWSTYRRIADIRA